MPYIVRWTETSSHYRELTDEEMAAIKGVSVAKLAELDDDEVSDGLENELANLDDEGFEYLERNVNEVAWQ